MTGRGTLGRLACMPELTAATYDVHTRNPDTGQQQTNVWGFYQDATRGWRWRVKAQENGEIIAASSQGYSRRIDCVRNAQRIGYTGPTAWGGSA